jgi:hypothetical protein
MKCLFDNCLPKKLAKDGDWFVITRDNQIKKKPHERKAWQEANLPIVFLQRSWMNFDFWNIAWRIIRYWPDVKAQASALRDHDAIILTINGRINLIKS